MLGIQGSEAETCDFRGLVLVSGVNIRFNELEGCAV